MPKTKKTFEQNIQELEKIISQLESGDAKLDDCIELYQNGVTLIAECTKMLNDAQQKVTMVTQQNTSDTNGD